MNMHGILVAGDDELMVSDNGMSHSVLSPSRVLGYNDTGKKDMHNQNLGSAFRENRD